MYDYRIQEVIVYVYNIVIGLLSPVDLTDFAGGTNTRLILIIIIHNVSIPTHTRYSEHYIICYYARLCRASTR